jgi:8-oxo-dGTP pyrophosphatase MutT (NUDIX family)
MPQVIQITAFDLRHTGDEWRFARDERERIEAHWQRLTAANSTLWNGKVLMCHSVAVDKGRLSARFVTSDFASFVACRDWDWPDKSVCNCFGSPVVISQDGALIYGRMGEKTLNAGLVYPPGGSLEPADVRADGTVDVRGSIERELQEETGLVAAEAEAGEWIAIFDSHRLSLARAYRFPLSGKQIEERVLRHITEAHEEELAGIEIVRSLSQLDSRTMPYAVEIARYFLGVQSSD